jgi:hypothetical protein
VVTKAQGNAGKEQAFGRGNAAVVMLRDKASWVRQPSLQRQFNLKEEKWKH